jgi:hypothetical protein
MSRSVFEHAVLSGANIHAGARHTDGTHPHNFWVSGSGDDGVGNGSWENPFLTVRRAIRQAYDGRGDRILLTAGSYTDTIDIGSGSTAGGNTNGGYAKRNLQILGDDSQHDGLVQIIGDGATATPTLRVQGDYLRGFVAKNFELDSNGLAQPALCLVSDDTGASPTSTADNYRFLIENVNVRSDDPDTGFLMQGATLGILRRCTIAGPGFGLTFTGSDSNLPSDLLFEDFRFYDNVTADVFTSVGHGSAAARGTVATINLANVEFWRFRFLDRGGTPVTNFVNMQGTCVNVHFFDFWAARDVADGTLMQLPANVVAIGHSAGGVESVIGS